MQQNEDKVEQGKASLEKMMETLRPFLPKPDAASPPPAYRWKLADDVKPQRAERESVLMRPQPF